MSQIVIKIGPADHGRRMSLDDFDVAEVTDGSLYELSRGVVTVSDVPGLPHALCLDTTRQQLAEWRATQPGLVRLLAAGNECKILIAGFESERHPDLSIYLSRPPDARDLWSRWIPEIVIEIVAPGSEVRDYSEKREEYLAFGVQEYWIIDPAKSEMLVLRRFRGRWTEQTVRPPQRYASRLLPGFEFDLSRVFAGGSIDPVGGAD